MTLSHEIELRDLEGWLIRKLLRKGYVCRKHIDIDDIPKGADPKYRKDILKLMEKLKKGGKLFSFPHGTKEKICLNKRFVEEFEKIIISYESKTRNSGQR